MAVENNFQYLSLDGIFDESEISENEAKFR